MTFMEKAIDKSIDIWENWFETPFIKGLIDDTLDINIFKHYIIQDTLYLKGYAKTFAYAMYRAHSLEEMNVYYSLMSFVNESEDATRLQYLNEWGITAEQAEAVPPCDTTTEYCNYMLNNAKTGTCEQILMATLPCTLGYYWLFVNLVKRHPEVLSGKYERVIRDYITDGYGIACENWSNYVNQLCKDKSEEEQEKLFEIFKTASDFELKFWIMSGGKA